ncbi:hypothetical protein G9A89_019009 [Geosiphon pyriformis]|nr:hypothetical protein G9A89_019009 [Geosiphon pyriformis]
MFWSGLKMNKLCKHLLTVKKDYQKSKYYEAEFVKNEHIKNVIDKHIESFSSNKGRMIKSVLEELFCKVVLNHLVIKNELILESEKIRSQINEIMVDWTHKKKVFSILPSLWACQYASLKHIDNTAFLGVINNISLGKLSLVVNKLPDSKTTGLSGILLRVGVTN